MAAETSPQYNHSVAVVPSDTVDLEQPCDAIFVGGAGTITVVWGSARTSQFTVTASQLLPFKARRINATGTAATLIHALYRV